MDELDYWMDVNASLPADEEPEARPAPGQAASMHLQLQACSL